MTEGYGESCKSSSSLSSHESDHDDHREIDEKLAHDDGGMEDGDIVINDQNEVFQVVQDVDQMIDDELMDNMAENEEVIDMFDVKEGIVKNVIIIDNIAENEEVNVNEGILENGDNMAENGEVNVNEVNHGDNLVGNSHLPNGVVDKDEECLEFEFGDDELDLID
ncbi:hypothetical protein L1987_35395 [Smallanthus sonchifolius]|uniref:Uncharacterized protein n=1 Tax=Smallanthus sonchifolius TaxID=185202 RepID=A0ACB9HWY9_9ASTR|nr:hypothetical protein L1987_35395 [Smallanthus sonchifolius]